MKRPPWNPDPFITSGSARAYTIPTQSPEADGTLEWDQTTIVVVRVVAAGKEGLGYTYAHKSLVGVIKDLLFPLLLGTSAMQTNHCWHEMRRAARNLGTRGLVAAAISAVDTSLWDLKAKILGLPLCDLLGKVRQEVIVYGSGGFTSYDADELSARISEYQEFGVSRVKMKVGAEPATDTERVALARKVLGDDTELFVDANGAYHPKQALSFAAHFADLGVTWFEEPVTSDDRAGLRFVREHCPPAMAVAAGEYGYDSVHFRDLIADQAVDILQADVTRCLGLTGFLEIAALCSVHSIPLSTHTAPALHLHLGLSVSSVIHLEYFRDHVRIENRFFDGARVASNGCLAPDLSLPGFGLAFKERDAEPFSVSA